MAAAGFLKLGCDGGTAASDWDLSAEWSGCVQPVGAMLRR
jgi:hypothetical protein